MTDFTFEGDWGLYYLSKVSCCDKLTQFFSTLRLQVGHTWPSWPLWLSSRESVLGGTDAFYLYLLLVFFGWTRAPRQEVERGHQVGNLWRSSWCYPCVCFHEPNPRRHTHSNSESSHVHSHTHTVTHKENFQPRTSNARALQTWHLDKILRANWQMSKGFDSRILERERSREGKNALIRMCCSYCVCVFECSGAEAAKKYSASPAACYECEKICLGVGLKHLWQTNVDANPFI